MMKSEQIAKSDTLNIKGWADARFEELLKSIKSFIAEGWTVSNAFHVVMDKSTIVQGYRAQMRKELGMGMFD